MGRQTQQHVLPKDLNELLVAMHEKEPLEVALRSGNSATPERQAFVPDHMSGQILVLWSERFAPNLQRRFVATADSHYYLADEQTESVFELSLSGVTTWEGRPALTQGRIYGVFQNKQAEFERCYEQIVRYIRRHWRKNPATWMGGYVGPAAGDWFDHGGLLLPNYIPPVRNDWIQRLGEQRTGEQRTVPPAPSLRFGPFTRRTRKQGILGTLNLEDGIHRALPAPSRLRNRKACFLRQRLLLNNRILPAAGTHTKSSRNPIANESNQSQEFHMSALNGDKSRYHRERKQKIARRQRTRKLLKQVAVEHKSADPSAGAKPRSVSA